MSSAIEIIDPEGERRRRWQRKILFLAVVLSAGLFAYPEVRDYRPKWDALKAGKDLALYLSMLKTKAISNRSPLEARFVKPDLIEVYEVSSCGPNAQRTKLWDTSIRQQSHAVEGVIFADSHFVHQSEDPAVAGEPVLQRFCYDPLYGSSVFADGLEHGSVFLIHEVDGKHQNYDGLVQVHVHGASADLSL